MAKRKAMGEQMGEPAATGAAAFAAAANPVLAQAGEAVVLDVPIDLIDGAEDNPRVDLGDLDELAASIAEVGILQRVVLMAKEGGRYLLVAGHRRKAAAALAGLATVPAEVRELTEAQRQAAMLVENLHRADLNAVEEAKGYQRLLDSDGFTGGQRALAKAVGKSQAHVSKRLALLGLPEEILTRVGEGKLSLSEAAALLRLAGHPARLRAAAKKGGYVERAVEDEERAIKREATIDRLTTEARNAGFDVIEARLDRHDGPVRLEWLDIDDEAATAEHRKGNCHAVVIEHEFWMEPRTVEVCTDPNRHREKVVETTPEGETVERFVDPGDVERDRRNAQRAIEEQARLDRERARIAFGAGLVKRPPTGDDLAVLAARTTVAHERDRGGAYDPLAPKPMTIRELLDGEPAELLGTTKAAGRRVLYAYTLATGEACLVRYGRYWEESDAARVYLSHLIEAGWEADEGEQQVLDYTDEEEEFDDDED